MSTFTSSFGSSTHLSHRSPPRHAGPKLLVGTQGELNSNIIDSAQSLLKQQEKKHKPASSKVSWPRRPEAHTRQAPSTRPVWPPALQLTGEDSHCGGRSPRPDRQPTDKCPRRARGQCRGGGSHGSASPACVGENTEGILSGTFLDRNVRRATLAGSFARMN